jgi:hypothetical protein
MKSSFTFLLILLTTIPLNVAKSQITIVSNARYTQYDADVDGDYVVYWGNQDQNHHIYLYKISDSSTTRITSVNNSSKGYPKISGNYVRINKMLLLKKKK